MADISTYLKQILSAVYGEDVRQSIHDAIQQCYTDGSAVSDAVADVIESKVESIINGKIADGTLEVDMSIEDNSITLEKLVEDLQNCIPSLVEEAVANEEEYDAADIADQVLDGITISGATYATNSAYKTYVISRTTINNFGMLVYTYSSDNTIIYRAFASDSDIETASLTATNYQYVDGDSFGDNLYMCITVRSADSVILRPINYTNPSRIATVDYGVTGFSNKAENITIKSASHYYDTTDVGNVFHFHLDAGIYAIVWDSNEITIGRMYSETDETARYNNLQAFPVYTNNKGYSVSIFYAYQSSVLSAGIRATAKWTDDTKIDEYIAILAPDADMVDKVRAIQPKQKRFIYHRANFCYQYRQALACGCSGIEIDIATTSDGVIVLSHDSSVNGTTIATSTYDELLEAVPYISTLEECLKICGKFQCYVYLHGSIADNFTECKRLANQYNLYDKTIFCTGSDEDETSIFAVYLVPDVSEWSENKKSRCIVYLNSVDSETFDTIPDGIRGESWATSGYEDALNIDRISGITTDYWYKVHQYIEAENSI